MNTNIDYWEKVLENPTDSFKVMFEAQKAYLRKHIRPDSKVLEIGCGDRRNLLSISDITEDLVGVDNDAKAIVDAKAKLSEIPKARVIFSDASTLPFPEKTFDEIIFFDLLYNLGNQKILALSEARRVLKDNGSIIVSAYSEHALSERLEIYKRINVPIKKIEEMTGRVFFDESVGANESEQFNEKQLYDMADEAGMIMTDCKEIKDIARICSFVSKR